MNIKNYEYLYLKYKNKYLLLKNNSQQLNGGGKRYFENMIGSASLPELKPKGLNPYLALSDEYLCGIDQTFISKQITSVAIKHNIEPSESTIIDLGCGHGNSSLSLSFNFNKVYGFDISQDMLTNSEKNKERLKVLRDDFNPDKVTFGMGSFNDKLPIEKPVNIILLNNAIHFAEIGTVGSVIDNLLEHLVENGLIIILEPSIDTKFGNPELNIPGPKRDRKMHVINTTRLELTEYLKKSTEKVETAFFDDLVRRDDKKVQYMVVIKKL
jgi:SAM-dependent methyltransferase